MQYLVSVSDPQIAEQIEQYLQNTEGVRAVPVPVFDDSFEAKTETEFLLFLISAWQFLEATNQEKIYHYLCQIVQTEIQEQALLFSETYEEDIRLANENMAFYQKNLELIDRQ